LAEESTHGDEKLIIYFTWANAWNNISNVQSCNMD